MLTFTRERSIGSCQTCRIEASVAAATGSKGVPYKLSKKFTVKRRTLIQQISLLTAAFASISRAASAAPFPIKKTQEQWRELVSPAAFQVLFEESTEPAGSSPLNAEKRAGTFVCTACSLPLLDVYKRQQLYMALPVGSAANEASFFRAVNWPGFLRRCKRLPSRRYC